VVGSSSVKLSPQQARMKCGIAGWLSADWVDSLPILLLSRANRKWRESGGTSSKSQVGGYIADDLTAKPIPMPNLAGTRGVWSHILVAAVLAFFFFFVYSLLVCDLWRS